MDTLQFILLTGVAVVGIAWAIDIPTTKWMFKYSVRRRKPLWQILQDSVRVTQETDTRETKPQAHTYTEAVSRMQEREKARTNTCSGRRDPPEV